MDEDRPPSPDAATARQRATVGSRVKNAYVAVARALGRAMVTIRVLPAAPPPRSQRTRHWLASLSRIHDSLGLAQLDVPWWTYRSIDVVENWLRQRRHPIRVFEYGSGASTFWLAQRVDEVISVEHDAAFADLIRPELARYPGVRLQCVPAPRSAAPRVGSAKSGNAGRDFYDYVHAIDSADGSFDLVVIDGRAREECLRVCLDRLAADGIVVFDNTHRRRYRRAIAASGTVERVFGGLTPTLPYPDRTSVLSLPAKG